MNDPRFLSIAFDLVRLSSRARARGQTERARKALRDAVQAYADSGTCPENLRRPRKLG